MLEIGRSNRRGVVVAWPAWLRALAGLTATPAIPVAVAVALGLYRAGEEGIWLDEGLAVAVARLPTLEMLNYVWRVEFHAALYYLLLHPWLALGESELAIRALSVVFGAAAVAATWAIGRRYGVGFAAALVLAVSPMFVQYEREARVFALLAATSAISTLLLLRLLERPTRWRAALYVVSAIALIYAHPLGGLVGGAHLVAVGLLVGGRLRWRLLALYVPVVIGWLPMIRFALSHRQRMAEIEPLGAEIITRELVILGGGIGVLLVLVPLLVLGARRDAVTLWLLVPIGGLLAVSLLIQPSILARYLLGVMPAAAVVAARNQRVLVGLLVVVSLVGVWHLYEQTEHERYRDAAAWVVADVQPGDGIVFAPAYLRPAFGYYARVGEPLYPAVAWSESDLLRGPPDLAAAAAAPRIWLVEAHSRALPDDLRAVLAAMPAAEVRDYGLKDLRVTLLVNDRRAAP